VLGAVPKISDYFQRVSALYDTHGMVLILDEVIRGMGLLQGIELTLNWIN